MERSGRVAVWAGVAMMVVCLLIGAVEASSVRALAAGPYLVLWLAVFGCFLGGLVAAAVLTPPRPRRVRMLVVGTTVLAASTLALLSPSRGGMAIIFVVLAVGMSALHVGLRTLVAILGWNTVVVVAVSAGLGPLVGAPGAPTEIVLTAVLYALLQAGTAAMVWSQQRVSEALADLSVAHVELRSTSALLAESSQAQERLRIARELHDVLGHQLTALALELEIASHGASGDTRECVLRARAMAKDLLTDVRAVVGTERHRTFDLATALGDVVGAVPQPRVHLDVDPHLDVDDARAAALLRVVQEVVTNAIRHSQAQNLHVRVTRTDGAVRLDACDDGVGAAEVTPGNGLRGLRERVEDHGGTVHLDGTDGFRVRAELPVPAAVPA